MQDVTDRRAGRRLTTIWQLRHDPLRDLTNDFEWIPEESNEQLLEDWLDDESECEEEREVKPWLDAAEEDKNLKDAYLDAHVQDPISMFEYTSINKDAPPIQTPFTPPPTPRTCDSEDCSAMDAISEGEDY